MAYRPCLRPEMMHGRQGVTRSLPLRRVVFFILVLISTFFAATAFMTIMMAARVSVLSWIVVLVFVFLFGWISMNFWTVVFGFIMCLRKRDEVLPVFEEAGPIAPQVRTAIIMPVYNEEMARIYSSLRATYESLKETGELDRFDFYILSDSTDSGAILMEETAWSELCRDVGGNGRIHYRRRKLRIHKKSGNVADFCRRWGSRYKYMIIFDADSLMEGELLVRMVNMMEAREDIGILQTAPMAMNQLSLISRLQQFASHVYGPLFFSGLRFWQLDESGFWGHNAIVRMYPFMKYCALPRLSGGPPFGGEILSHDFVEAALMRRAGWGVWLAYELEGSYEELPPNLLEELERDRRWCQGNIQHLRLMFMKGISLGHRLLFLNGNLFYFSSFFWFLLLFLMTFRAVANALSAPVYFSAQRTLFPSWPLEYRELSINLLVTTAVLLFIPKVLSFVLIIRSPQGARRFGGAWRLAVSVLAETVFSILLAPLRMIFHTWYVVLNLIGQKLVWKSQARHLKRTSFSEAFRAHWPGTAGAFIWALTAYMVSKTLFWWVSLIVVPLVLAVPISVFFSYPSLGRFFRRRGLFLTPVETAPSKVLCLFQRFFYRNMPPE
jgi:membrane glycosyltransferase